jgi:hypothetical protein
MENLMEENTQQVTPILAVAWKHFAQLDAISLKRSKSHLRLRWWIAALGVLATLFAILTTLFPETSGLGFIIKLLLIASPILASGIAAFVKGFFSTGDWLVTRAGAEEILKEIYAYRTILQKAPGRHAWLEKRLEEIQRSVYRGMNGELILEPYEGVLPPPPRFSPDYPNSDPGFNDLTGDEYFRYRLENQLEWHTHQVIKRHRERNRLRVLVILSGIIGALLAAVGTSIAVWAALPAAFTAAFIGWQELRGLDSVVRNYSKVVMELTILSNHWRNLESEEQTQTEFFKIVKSAEDILWGQNVEYIKAMQEALKESDLEQEASLINRVIKEQRESDQRFRQGITDATVEFVHETMLDTEESLTDTYKSTLGTLAEEASSELVQAELAAMGQAISDTVQTIAQTIGIADKLKGIADEFAGVEIGSDTPTSVLNDLMSRYPKSGEVKG